MKTMSGREFFLIKKSMQLRQYLSVFLVFGYAVVYALGNPRPASIKWVDEFFHFDLLNRSDGAS